MTKHSLQLLGAASLMFASTLLPAQDKPGMTAVDMLNVPGLSDPQLAPDGNALVYTFGEANWKANKRINHLWYKSLPDGEAFQLTRGEEGESSPRWSPDGRLIAFITERDDDENEQIYLISPRGGEAWALTELDTSPSDISWSADSSTIYFLADIPKTKEEKKQEKQKDDVFAFDNNWKHRHLWQASVSDGTVAQITEGEFSVNEYSLSRDGSRFVIHRAPSPLLDDSFNSEIFLLTVQENSWRQLTNNSQREGGGELSPDGTAVMFVSGTNANFEEYYDTNLFVVPAKGGAHQLLLEDLPYSVEDATWSADGESILFAANTGARSNLFKVGVPSQELTQLTNGDHALADWSYVPGLDAHVATVSTATNPGDVWQLRDGATNRLTDAFDYVAENYWLPDQELISWQGADGTTVEGVLYYPRNFQAGIPAPLIVQTHGGPRASDKLSFPGARNFVQLATNNGWLILKPNYRGSTGYGDEFMRNQVGNYWDQSHLDVLTGVDHLINEGIADAEHLVKMGWSAGGHMTNKIVTSTDRFKAASSGAGAANWLSMYSQTDIRVHRGNWFGGAPWEQDAPVEQYWEQSPLREAWKVSTPTLLIVGEADQRVPAPQSVEFYRALKANGVDTELHMAPREGHGWRELRHQLFKINVELAWFDKHVFGREYQWEEAPSVPDEEEE
ncbi:MAG: S9 family peptidase [Proteobacteria bacterium]|nr:S9 family peptidase [Pseudomonadota bacterium]